MEDFLHQYEDVWRPEHRAFKDKLRGKPSSFRSPTAGAIRLPVPMPSPADSPSRTTSRSEDETPLHSAGPDAAQEGEGSPQRAVRLQLPREGPDSSKLASPRSMQASPKPALQVVPEDSAERTARLQVSAQCVRRDSGQSAVAAEVFAKAP